MLHQKRVNRVERCAINLHVPWLTVKMDFKGFRRKATQIMIVQTDIEEPVIQNMNRVIKICFDGDFANSQAFYSKKVNTVHAKVE